MLPKTLLSVVGAAAMLAVTPASQAQETPVALKNKVILAQNGQPSAVIVLPDPVRDNPDRLTPLMADQAAKMLGEFLKRMTGASFKTVYCADLGEVSINGDQLTSARVPAASYILVGESALTRQLKVTPELTSGAMYIKAAGNVLTLIGPADGVPYTGGTIYAVHKFLEDQGVCYLWPGELGLAVPKRTDLAVDYEVQSFTPPIKQRTIRTVLGGNRSDEGAKHLGLSADYVKKTVEAAAIQVPFTQRSLGGWVEWQNIGGTIGISGGHSLGDLWDRFGATHPGWFALQPDGTRKQHNSERAQLCLSNSELVQQVADDLIARADKAPGTYSLPLSLNDGGQDAFCMCEVNTLGEPGCVTYDALDGPKIEKLWGWNKPYVSLTDRYITFCNRVAEKVVKKHPNLLMVVDAYSAYSTPPVHTKLNPNLVVRYVPSTMDDWDAWSNKASKIYWRPNTLGAGYRFAELKFNRSICDDLRYAAHHSTVATDFDAIMNNWATEGLNYYVVAKLNWNPDQNPDDLIDQYCRGGFGPAAADIRHYFKRVDETGVKMYARVSELALGDPDKITVAARGDALAEFWTPQLCTELRGILDTADKKAAGDNPDNQLVRRRIDFLRTGLVWTEMQSNAFRTLIAFKKQQPVDLNAANEMLKARRAMMHKMFEENPLAVNVAYLDFGDRGYWQPLQKAIDAATGASSKTGATTVDADENGQPIITPKN